VRLRDLKPLLSLLLALAVSLASAPSAYAWPPTFGPEWTFTNRKLIDGFFAEGFEPVEAMLEKVAQYYRSPEFKESCPKCRVEVFHEDAHDKIKLTFPGPERFYVILAVDPTVIEVTGRPSTLEELRKYRDLVQTHLFDLLKNRFSLKPDVRQGYGLGNIHFGTQSTFGRDTQKNLLFFRNYLADRANHPELTRVNGMDLSNAPALADLPVSAQNDFERVLDGDFTPGVLDDLRALAGFDFRSRAERLHQEPRQALRDAINTEVYGQVDNEFAKPSLRYPLGTRPKYHATNIVSDTTVEERSQFAQESMDEYIDQAEIRQTRLEWLKKISDRGEKIPLKLKEARKLLKDSKSDPSVLAKAYFNYISEIGLTDKWETYRKRFRDPVSSVRARCGLEAMMKGLNK
jgi:hypothetical protein